MENKELKDIFYISEDDWYELQGWATIAYDKDKNEISGLMTAVPQKDGRIKVGDVEILKQENTGTNTELEGEAVSEYMMKYGMKYNNPNMKFVWWHSHHTMGAFWSGTDVNEIEAWKNNSYSLALVINLKEEYLFRVSFWNMNGLPMEQHIDTNLTIERKVPKIQITKAMEKQYKELCSKPKQPVYSNTGYGLWNRNSNQRSLWARTYKQNEELAYEQAYQEFVEVMENAQDAFMDGTMSHKEWNKRVSKINKACKKDKFPFKVKEYKMNKQQLMNKLMSTMPSELFEWDDNNAKDMAETINWNNSFGVYDVY
jgi:proteasome lid subunit RPN8/RPN11